MVKRRLPKPQSGVRFPSSAPFYFRAIVYMKVAFHTLGCKVNQYESEAMAGMFRRAGYEIVGEEDFADVYVINTCTVTATADKKSRQYIRRMKKVNGKSIVAVTGCYAQVDPQAVSAICDVDIVVGVNEKGQLLKLVREFTDARRNGRKPGEDAVSRAKIMRISPYEMLSRFEELGPVMSTEGRTRAYVKIQEGCNRFCSYCVIPYARGPIRSRPIENIIEEAEMLVKRGCKEIVLTGINTAMYGMEGIDLYSGTPGVWDSEMFGVEKVISAVSRIKGDFRIRLSSLEPAVVNADYVKRLLRYDRLCHHLHMSAQSGSSRVLGKMNRPYTREQYIELVETLHEFDPCYGISTDMIVGFPGEKERDFADSVSLVERCGFCRTHVFKYSKRPVTEAAAMREQTAPQIKQQRSEELRDAGSKAARRFFEMNISRAGEGRTETVLFEELTPDRKFAVGYTGNYIKTYTDAGDGAENIINTFKEVRLVSIYNDGVMASVVE